MGDSKPPADPWTDRPLTAEELRAVRDRLSKMPQPEVVKFFIDGLAGSPQRGRRKRWIAD